jgi:hypothetical protein
VFERTKVLKDIMFSERKQTQKSYLYGSTYMKFSNCGYFGAEFRD